MGLFLYGTVCSIAETSCRRVTDVEMSPCRHVTDSE